MTTSNNKCNYPCGLGTYNPIKGQTSCLPCSSGQIATIGATYCTPCAAGTQPDSTKSTCVPIPSGGPRRRRATIPDCQDGFSACPNRQGLKTIGYECVDTSEDIESCGGCPGEGTECTAFDSIATAACVKGRCSYTCPRGYDLGVDGCVRSNWTGLDARQGMNKKLLIARGAL